MNQSLDIQTIALVSLGCPKNLVDSEKMMGLLAEDGLTLTDNEAIADAIIVNTCGFLEDSKDESLEVIREVAKLKKSAKLKRLVVAGCLVQRHRAKMLQWCPEIDALIGVFDRDKIVQAVRPNHATQNDLNVDLPVYSSIAANATIARNERNINDLDLGYYESDASRFRLTPRHTTYLRISEGCNQNCAFCTIPSIRGKMRSKPIDKLLSEADELLRDGAFELNLIGQDTTSYGQDITYEPGLAGMLTELDQLAQQHGGAWLRLMYAYPTCFTDAMIDTIAKLPNLLKYIDIPLQHINDIVLDNMRRNTSRKLIETLLHKLRDRVPDIAIRTTFITGFPGETEAQHNELKDFIADFGFDNLGVFGYSPEPGTPAGTMCEQGLEIDGELIAQRYEELMLVQQEVVFERNQQAADEQKQHDILIEGQAQGIEIAGADGQITLYVGRSSHQAPDVDSITYVQSNKELTTGELIRCTTIGYDHYDLIAQPTAQLSADVSLPVL